MTQPKEADTLDCSECGSGIHPVAVMGEPGMSCGCQWSQITKREFRARFGFSFSPKMIVKSPNVFSLQRYGTIETGLRGVSGNAAQRRKARRLAYRRAGLGR